MRLAEIVAFVAAVVSFLAAVASVYLAFTIAAYAQEFGNFSPPSMTWDRIELRESSAGHLAEVITVTPVNPQHMAFPPDPQPVADGEEIVIQIGGGIS